MGACCSADPTIDNEVEQMKLTPLNADKVMKMWRLRRGHTDDKQKIKAMLDGADLNGDGALDRDESRRLCKKVYHVTEQYVKSDNSRVSDQDATIAEIFVQLDSNNDGVLELDEVEVAIKAIWLMITDGVSLDDLVGDIEPGFEEKWRNDTPESIALENDINPFEELEQVVGEPSPTEKPMETGQPGRDGGAHRTAAHRDGGQLEAEEVEGEDDMCGYGSEIPEFPEPEEMVPLIIEPGQSFHAEVSVPRLSKAKVQAVWGQCRVGEDGRTLDGPSEDMVKSAITKAKEKYVEDCKKKDKEVLNSQLATTGYLTKQEARRISKAFRAKAKWEHKKIDMVFQVLDTNNDGLLDLKEVSLAMQSMWMMDSDNVNVEDLIEY